MEKIELTKSQVKNLMEFFEIWFIHSIRENDVIDNIDYVVDMCEIYTKLKEAREEMFGDERE